MATIQIRIDDKLKAEADALFSDVGLDTPTAIRAFLKQSVMRQGLPFSLTRDIPNAETIAAMEEVNAGRNLSRPFHSIGELMEDLNA